MSKKPTPKEIRDHYRPNVVALSTNDLLLMVRGGSCFKKGTPKYIATELQKLADIECRKRGIEFPIFNACFIS